MAFNNYNSYDKKKSYNDKQYTKSKPTVEKIEAEVLPDDYVDLAETNMGELISERQAPTTSKLRNILSIIMDIYNEENRRNENANCNIKLSILPVRISLVTARCGLGEEGAVGDRRGQAGCGRQAA